MDGERCRTGRIDSDGSFGGKFWRVVRAIALSIFEITSVLARTVSGEGGEWGMEKTYARDRVNQLRGKQSGEVALYGYIQSF